MKKEKLNTLQERDIILGLIVSDDFCKEIIPILNPRHLEVEYARTVSTWIKKYYENFNVAPKKDIMKLYRANINDINDEALQDNILSFIQKVDKDYDSMASFNTDYLIQESVKYLKSKSLKNLSQDIESYLMTNDVDKAESLLTKYKKVEKGSGESVSILSDFETVLTSFTEEKDKLFSFNGDFGKLVGDVHREDFISFLAPMKAGKTFSLIDAGIEAVKNGLKVVFFSLEMSRTQMVKRIWKTLSGQVTEDMTLEIPQFVENGNKFELDFKTVKKKASSILDVEKKQKSLKRIFRGGEFLVFAEPAYSLTVEKLETKLDDLEIEGFVPDVIIIDYADIMMPSEKGEYRQQLDSIWKRLRALAQKRKAVVFTASQTNRGGLSGPVELENIAEDIRKVAHVTSMVSISRNKYCKENSIAIYSQLAVRDGEPITKRVVATQCLALGRPVLDSHWENDVILDDFEDDEKDDEKSERKYKK